MTTRELLLDEIEATPERILQEVYHYMVYLKTRQQETQQQDEPLNNDSFNGLLLSESALAAEWLTPEEEAAWQNL